MTFDDLKEKIDGLEKLLADPQPGLHTYHEMVTQRMNELCDESAKVRKREADRNVVPSPLKARLHSLVAPYIKDEQVAVAPSFQAMTVAITQRPILRNARAFFAWLGEDRPRTESEWVLLLWVFGEQTAGVLEQMHARAMKGWEDAARLTPSPMLVVDHRDGDPTNNDLPNLRITEVPERKEP